MDYLPIPLDQGIPLQPHGILSLYATCRPVKAKYIELWYVANEGLDSGQCSNLAANSNSIVVVSNNNSTTSWQASAQLHEVFLQMRTSLGRLFVPPAFSLSQPWLVLNGWTSRLTCLQDYLAALSPTPVGARVDSLECHALHVYLVEQRCNWHSTTVSMSGGDNITVFNSQVTVLRDAHLLQVPYQAKQASS